MEDQLDSTPKIHRLHPVLRHQEALRCLVQTRDEVKQGRQHGNDPKSRTESGEVPVLMKRRVYKDHEDPGPYTISE